MSTWALRSDAQFHHQGEVVAVAAFFGLHAAVGVGEPPRLPAARTGADHTRGDRLQARGGTGPASLIQQAAADADMVVDLRLVVPDRAVLERILAGHEIE